MTAAGTGSRRVPSLGAIALFSSPSAGYGFAFFLVTLYLLKFSTDVLLLSPESVGVVLSLAKLWDAVSDPVAGHLSDRTRSRWGRRRIWLLLALLPLAIGLWMMWSPPGLLEGPYLLGWMAFGVFSFYTATTMFLVPHESLVAELSTGHHERTLLFGVRHGVATAGTALAVVALQALTDATDPRALAPRIAIAVGVATALLTLASVFAVREPEEHQGRGGVHLLAAFRDVLRNPHAALLLLVFFIENFGTAVLGVLTPYAMQYVLGMSDRTGWFIGIYFVPALLSIPLWIRLSARVGKKQLWLFSMALLSLAFGGLFFVREGDELLVYALGALAGLGGGCGQVVAPSIQADIIDYDELRTGERKEGMYFAVWNFVRKAAQGLTIAGAGFMLAAVGYQANVEQSETAKLGIRLLFGGLPGICFALGTLLFLRFRLDEREHREIRRVLDERAAERAARSAREGGGDRA